MLKKLKEKYFCNSLQSNLVISVGECSISAPPPKGCGGGASSRVMAFCPSGPGSNPGGAQGSNLGFFVSDVVNLFSLGVVFSLGVGHFSYQ